MKHFEIFCKTNCTRSKYKTLDSVIWMSHARFFCFEKKKGIKKMLPHERETSINGYTCIDISDSVFANLWMLTWNELSQLLTLTKEKLNRFRLEVSWFKGIKKILPCERLKTSINPNAIVATSWAIVRANLVVLHSLKSVEYSRKSELFNLL